MSPKSGEATLAKVWVTLLSELVTCCQMCNFHQTNMGLPVLAKDRDSRW